MIWGAVIKKNVKKRVKEAKNMTFTLRVVPLTALYLKAKKVHMWKELIGSKDKSSLWIWGKNHARNCYINLPHKNLSIKQNLVSILLPSLFFKKIYTHTQTLDFKNYEYFLFF